MAIATLFRRSTGKAAGRSRTDCPARTPRKSADFAETSRTRSTRNESVRTADGRIDADRIEQAEDRLLARALDHHPRRERALDRLADDIENYSEIEHARREPLLLRSTASLNRAEDLVLQAIIQTHPNGERAIERLLEDVAPEIDSAPALPPDFVDCDYDGLS